MQSVMNRRQIFFALDHVVEHKTTGTCIVVAVIELYMYTYLFNFSGEDSVKDFD